MPVKLLWPSKEQRQLLKASQNSPGEKGDLAKKGRWWRLDGCRLNQLSQCYYSATRGTVLRYRQRCATRDHCKGPIPPVMSQPIGEVLLNSLTLRSAGGDRGTEGQWTPIGVTKQLTIKLEVYMPTESQSVFPFMRASRTFSNSPGFHQLITCFTFSPPALTCFRERVALEAGLSRGIAFIKISQKVTSGTQPSSPHHRPTLDRPGAPRYPFAS
ncbi:uncharacterized protein PGTG_06326 [Puccinia graminis f. sp. tritici CRL 75-36-700-3]|uniref:Uncharacterized protein n=1 Tax=Puccinia graminis f. sp. tritici (strain CRL 75-36-700-3 / race SCCL) TaxID=418459 RepID=E3K7S2_PUCGT|nr:uncharacterized protein PGTG_06326 [Puccinia graminis f. sp. tritici CRL 75-36-700-3]EFP80370.1 hypothetical protein PGTG_06326 [Puccinia graminis f. sp. tritici CRL 75-36-700-3]